MRYRGNGGIVGPTLSSNTSYAPGVWGIPDFQQRLSAGTWPTDLTATLLQDPYFDYNTLLMKAVGANTTQNYTFLDSSTNNRTITRNGDVNQGAFSPHAYADGYWSVYYDGTGDYLNIPDNDTAFLIDGDFTIEAWVYPTSLSTDGTILAQWGGGNSVDSFIFRYTSLGRLYFAWRTSATSSVTGTSTSVTINQWNHVAVTRSGSTVRMFVNGVLDSTTATVSGTFNNVSTAINIGYLISSSPLHVNGYLSNVRMVKGTALYTTNFTPSITPLTAVSGTSLLACQSNRFRDNSSNAFTITRNGDSKITTFGPFNPSIYSASTNGGSIYFDGSGDTLSIPYNSALTFGSGDFTIEQWLYPQRTSGQNSMLNGIWDSINPPPQSWFQYLNSSGNFIFLADNASGGTDTTIFTSTDPIPNEAWTHVAVTRSGNTWRLFINGVLDKTTTNSLTLNTGSNPLILAGYTNLSASDNLYKGYISNYRIVKGTALYTNTFTPSTTPLTEVSGTSLLLSGTNAGIVDASRKSNLYTFGNVQVRTNVFKYDKSVYFDGTGDYLRALSSDLTSDLGTSNFTIECWVYKVSGAPIVSNSDGGNDNNYFLLESNSGNTSFQIRDASSQAYAYGPAVSTNTWTHVAVTRSSGSVTVYVNGTGGTPVSITKTITNRSTIIGAFLYTGFDNYFNGYIEDLRITKGFARYTTNFTPPSAVLQTS
jgi:hypothetical protein